MNLGGAEARIIGSGDNISARQHEPEAGYHLEAFTRQRWRASFNDACRRMRPGDDRTSAIRRRTRRRDHHARHGDGLATKPCRLVQDPIGGGAIGSSGKRLRLDQTPRAAIRSILSLRRNRRDRKQEENKRSNLKGLCTAESVQQTAERRREFDAKPCSYPPLHGERQTSSGDPDFCKSVPKRPTRGAGQMHLAPFNSGAWKLHKTSLRRHVPMSMVASEFV